MRARAFCLPQACAGVFDWLVYRSETASCLSTLYTTQIHEKMSNNFRSGSQKGKINSLSLCALAPPAGGLRTEIQHPVPMRPVSNPPRQPRNVPNPSRTGTGHWQRQQKNSSLDTTRATGEAASHARGRRTEKNSSADTTRTSSYSSSSRASVARRRGTSLKRALRRLIAHAVDCLRATGRHGANSSDARLYACGLGTSPAGSSAVTDWRRRASLSSMPAWLRRRGRELRGRWTAVLLGFPLAGDAFQRNVAGGTDFAGSAHL